MTHFTPEMRDAKDATPAVSPPIDGRTITYSQLCIAAHDATEESRVNALAQRDATGHREDVMRNWSDLVTLFIAIVKTRDRYHAALEEIASGHIVSHGACARIAREALGR